MNPEISAVIGATLLALGIVAPADQLAGGMFFAISLSFLVMAYSQPEKRRGYVVTLITAVLMAICGAVAHDVFFPHWSLHALMGVPGALSRFIAEGLLAFGEGTRDQMGKLPELIRKRFFKGDDDVS